mgnify:CR=1 FL=1
MLAERGVLPKYGFPTDVVELHLDDRGKERGLADLQLSRGLRQAIREYAPGAEVVAGKRLWRSKGLKTPRWEAFRRAISEPAIRVRCSFGG